MFRLLATTSAFALLAAAAAHAQETAQLEEVVVVGSRAPARLAYNYASMRMSERVNNTTAYRNRYDGADDSLDFKIRYKVNDNLWAQFTASNLIGADRTEWIGWDRELTMVTADYGSAYFVGFNLRY